MSTTSRAFSSALRKPVFGPRFVRSQPEVVSSLQNIAGKRTVFSPSFVMKRAVNTEISNKTSKAGFSDVNLNYERAAPIVGLDPSKNLYDAPFYTLRRSRIPTALFKDIVKDMDFLMIQYGSPQEHESEIARSRFLAPIFNHLVAQFGGSIKNKPFSLLNDGNKTRGKTECHFTIYGGNVIVFVEVDTEIGGYEYYRDAVAEVIMECDACNWKNAECGYELVPIYGIFYDASENHFRFFIFDGRTKPFKFSIGVDTAAPGLIGSMIGLYDTQLSLFNFPWHVKPTQAAQASYIHSLRPICEIIFNLLLLAYIETLKTMKSPFLRRWPNASEDDWDRATKFAEEALEKSQDAEKLRQHNSIVEADKMADAALIALKMSVNVVPIAKHFTTIPLMDGWIDDEVAKV